MGRAPPYRDSRLAGSGLGSSSAATKSKPKELYDCTEGTRRHSLAKVFVHVFAFPRRSSSAPDPQDQDVLPAWLRLGDTVSLNERESLCPASELVAHSRP